MITICTIITFLMAGAMFVIPRAHKIAIMFIVNMLFSLLQFYFIPGLQNAISLIIFVFFVSEIKYIKLYVNKIKNNPKLRLIFLLLITMTSLDVIFSPHLHNNLIESIKYVYSYLLLKYFLVFYSVVAVTNSKCLLTLVKYSMVGVLVLTFFGIINLIQGRSEFVTDMMSNHTNLNFVTADAGEKFVGSSRFRVQAMFQNPFDYGFICCVCLMLFLYAREHIRRFIFVVLMLCCLFGILTCNCRTVVVCAVAGLGIYVFLAFNFSKQIKFASITAVVLVLLYSFVPAISEKIDSAMSAITDTEGKEYAGSSMMMRSIQIAATLGYIEDKPLFGNGVGFFNIDLGWNSSDKSLTVDKDLYGLEGVYLSYLLEHGWVGYILYLMLWIIILRFLIRNLQIDRNLASFGIAVWTVYFLFAHMTGELKSLYPTLLVLGSIIGVFTCNKHVSSRFIPYIK